MVFKSDDGAMLVRKQRYFLKQTIQPVLFQRDSMRRWAEKRNGAIRIMPAKGYDRSDGVTNVPLRSVCMQDVSFGWHGHVDDYLTDAWR